MVKAAWHRHGGYTSQGAREDSRLRSSSSTRAVTSMYTSSMDAFSTTDCAPQAAGSRVHKVQVFGRAGESVETWLAASPCCVLQL